MFDICISIRLTVLMLLSLVLVLPANAQKICNQLVDDFTGSSLNLSDWLHPESTRYLLNGKLVLSNKLISSQYVDSTSGTQRFRLDFAGFPDDIAAKVSLIESNLHPEQGTNSSVGWSFSSIRGTFYNSVSDNSNINGNLGDVWVSVYLGNRGNGIEIWWEILRVTSPDWSTWDLIGTGNLYSPGSASLNTEYTLGIKYDGSTGFTFSANSVTASGNGPARKTTQPYGDRSMAAGVLPAYGPSGIGDLRVASETIPISAVGTFDDVMVDSILYDDFSGTQLDQGKWKNTLSKRFLENGKLRNEVSSQSATERLIWNQPNEAKYTDANCVQATLSLLSSSTIPTGSVGKISIDGFWYNTLFNGAGYDGYKGNVYAELVIERASDGLIYVYAWAGSADDAIESSYTQIAFHSFNINASLDTEYVAAIKLNKLTRQLIFKFANLEYVHNIAGNIFPIFPDYNYNSITTRIDTSPGTVHATIDDVYVTPSDIKDVDDNDFILLYLPAIINAAKQ